MPLGNTSVAWIQPLGNGEFLATFISPAAATQNAPTNARCASVAEAKHWIEARAACLGLPVEWVDRTGAT
jgi:hypothetical protein